jgi:hypothetical protein
MVLNKLWAEKPKESAPAATGPTTDEAAPKKEEETAQPEEMKVDQALLNNVKAILSIGSQKALRPGSPSNEMQLIKNMVAAIMPMTGGSEPVAFDYLAKVLIRENLDQLSAKFAGDISRDLYNAKISDLRVNLAGIGKKGLYEAQVAAVLDAVVRLNRRLGTNMAAYFQGAKSQKKSSLVNPKIEKLATLRRLRVRSQMEAAIESSARFGRSRVS